MRINVYGSGSTGNCYGISDGKTSFLLECGVQIKKLNKVSGFALASYEAVISSHEHQDHCSTIAEMHRRGLTIYCTKHAAELHGIDGMVGVNIIHEKESIKVGTFTILPFPLKHNNTGDMTPCECYGFLIYSRETKERLLFVTDTMYIPQRFQNLNYIMIEVNYIQKNMKPSDFDFIDGRRMQTHMSLETAVDFIKHQDLSKVRKVVAIHLSESRADADEILRSLRRATGRACYIATEGLCLE